MQFAVEARWPATTAAWRLPCRRRSATCQHSLVAEARAAPPAPPFTRSARRRRAGGGSAPGARAGRAPAVGRHRLRRSRGRARQAAVSTGCASSRGGLPGLWLGSRTAVVCRRPALDAQGTSHHVTRMHAGEVRHVCGVLRRPRAHPCLPIDRRSTAATRSRRASSCRPRVWTRCRLHPRTPRCASRCGVAASSCRSWRKGGRRRALLCWTRPRWRTRLRGGWRARRVWAVPCSVSGGATAVSSAGMCASGPVRISANSARCAPLSSRRRLHKSVARMERGLPPNNMVPALRADVDAFR